LSLKLETGTGFIRMVGKPIVLKSESKTESEFFIMIPKSEIKGRKTVLKVGVYSGDEKLETIKTNFLGPVSLN